MLHDLINETAYLPQGSCLLWKPWLLALYAVSNLLIAVAYFAIPLAILAFVRKRPSLEMKNLALLFAAFIALCGLTHILSVVTLWWPIYETKGAVTLMTAMISVITAIAIVPLVPKALAIPSPYELQLANKRLQSEAESHHRTMTELISARHDLELRVNERTEELSAAVEQVSLLMRELAHRSKNLLAVVQSMARQTLRSAGNPAEFEERFFARLQGLARANDELLQNEWRGADVERLVRSQLVPFVGQGGDRVRLEGPKLLLTPEAAQNMALAMHELATNAAKHGALARPTGRVRVRWGTEQGVEQSRFVMTWEESGVPTVRVPQTTGFGFVVLTKVVPSSLDGEASLSFDPDGLTWTLDAPAEVVLGTSRRS